MSPTVAGSILSRYALRIARHGPCCWRRESAAPPVAGQTDALEHGIDPITIALGVAQPLQHHDADFAAGQWAIGLVVDATHQRNVRAALVQSPARADP